MAYVLNAIIGFTKAIDTIALDHNDARVVRLSDSFSMIPITEDFYRHIEPDGTRYGDNGGMFNYLSPRMSELIRFASVNAPVGYFGAEFFGSDGNQCAVIYSESQTAFGPLIARTAINPALRALGVTRSKGLDEFDTLGLGKHRVTEEWVFPIEAKQTDPLTPAKARDELANEAESRARTRHPWWKFW